MYVELWFCLAYCISLTLENVYFMYLKEFYVNTLKNVTKKKEAIWSDGRKGGDKSGKRMDLVSVKKESLGQKRGIGAPREHLNHFVQS